jgi:hypothetical protein
MLDVDRHDDAGHCARADRDAHGAVHQVRRLLRRHARLHELAGHVLEQRLEVHLLKPFGPERHALLLPDDRDHGLVVELRVVQAVQELDGAGSRGGDAHADLARELRVGTGRKRRDHLVAHLDELGPAARSRLAVEPGLLQLLKRAHEPVDAVARVSVDPPDPPLVVEAVEHELADRARHVSLGRRPRARR